MSLSRELAQRGVQRSFLIFENSGLSEQSLITYKYHLNRFLRFTKLKDYDSIVSLETDDLQLLLENYAIHLKNIGNSGVTIRSSFTALTYFLEINKKSFFKKALHKMFPEPKKAGGFLQYTNEDIQKILSVTGSLRAKSLVHVLASTGARKGVFVDPVLRFKHLYPMPFGCLALKLYDDSRQEYWGFLIPEAVKVLEEYKQERIRIGEKLDSESPVFSAKDKDGNYTHMKLFTVNETLTRLVKRSGIDRVKTRNRFDKALSYGFRKRFNTILKINNDVNSNIAEKLMAHKRGLDGVYFTPTREQCFEEFVKAIHELTIDESERLKLKLDKSESDKDRMISDLTKRLTDVEKILSYNLR